MEKIKIKIFQEKYALVIWALLSLHNLYLMNIYYFRFLIFFAIFDKYRFEEFNIFISIAKFWKNIYLYLITENIVKWIIYHFCVVFLKITIDLQLISFLTSLRSHINIWLFLAIKFSSSRIYKILTHKRCWPFIFFFQY